MNLYYFKTFIKSNVIVFITLLFSCENSIEKINLITQTNNFPVESGKNIELLYSEYGNTTFKLISPKYEKFIGENPYIKFPQGLHVQFFDSLMKVSSDLTCKYAIKYEKEKKIEGKNDVVVVNSKGEKLNTEYLIWDERKDMIYTNKFVKITTKDEVIMGEGLESNSSFTKYKIMKIKGTIKVKNEQ